MISQHRFWDSHCLINLCLVCCKVRCIPSAWTYSEFIGFSSQLPEPKDKCNFACDNRLAGKMSLNCYSKAVPLPTPFQGLHILELKKEKDMNIYIKMDSFWKEVEEYISTAIFTILIFIFTFVRGFISLLKITNSRNYAILYLSLRQHITTIFSVTVFRTKLQFYISAWSTMNGLCFLLKSKVPQPSKPWPQINLLPQITKNWNVESNDFMK